MSKYKPAYVPSTRERPPHWHRAPAEVARRKALAVTVEDLRAAVVAAAEKRLARIERDLKHARHT